MIFIDIAIIFTLGSLIGWLIELIFVGLIKKKKLVNPGFLNGPYLSIYGAGAILLYFVSGLNIDFIFKLLLFIISTTLLELIVGLFFFYYYNLRLWDYSDKMLNYQGHICLICSFYWAILSILFYFFIYPVLSNVLLFFNTHIGLLFVLGLFYGIFLVDLINSFSLANKMREFLIKFNKNRLVKLKVNYVVFKQKVTLVLKQKHLAGLFKGFFFSFNNLTQNDLSKQLEKFLEIRKERFKNGLEKIKKIIKNVDD